MKVSVLIPIITPSLKPITRSERLPCALVTAFFADQFIFITVLA